MGSLLKQVDHAGKPNEELADPVSCGEITVVKQSE